MDPSNFDQDGFIKDPATWNESLGKEIAAQEGITRLTDEHWQIIRQLRRHYFETGGVPVMRHMCREAGLEEHCVSELLSDPRRAWRIAGLPNPGEEAKAYMEAAELHD